MTLRNHPYPFPHCRENAPRSPTSAKTDEKAKLIQYARWSYPEAEICQVANCCEIRCSIPMLEKESVVLEVGEDILVLSGLRWETRPGDREFYLVPFRRIIQLPGVVNDDRCRADYEYGILVLTLTGVEHPDSE